MPVTSKSTRGLGLCSGGLDSILAALLLQQQKIDVTWISFETPFFSADKARRAAQRTGIPLIVEDITKAYLEMFVKPPAGYGQHLNPCMDCHSLMFRRAGRRLHRAGFDFLFSGEVLGQRPMSQTRPSLRYVEKHSGYDGLIVRPLSALRLPETIPEQKGLVQRSRLLGLAGRSRKPQIQLARAWGIQDYPAPAGGCLLTDAGFTRRLQDLLDHRIPLWPRYLHLLKYGRHLRLNKAVRAVVGRTQKDNEAMQQYLDAQADITMVVRDFPGPTLLIPGPLPAEVSVTEELARLAAICAGYSNAPAGAPVTVSMQLPGAHKTVTVERILPEEIKLLLI